MSAFTEFDDRAKANIFLKCFSEFFTRKEGIEVARQLDVMDYPDFIELLRENMAIKKTSLGYRINRHYL
jgi:hypothetical protein